MPAAVDPGTYDVVIVGSGINSLVCAALLGQRGRSVCVLERNDTAGGCIRTAEVTAPGFRHDLFSMSYPLFVTAPHYPQLRPGLEAAGLRFVTGERPTAVVLPDGRSLILSRDRVANRAALEAVCPGDGDAYVAALGEVERDAGLIFGILGQEAWSTTTARLLAREVWRRGARPFAAFFGDALSPQRTWLEREFRSDLVRALLAPWVLHTGLGPDDALSALMTKVIMFTLEGVGIPFVAGGSSILVEAFRRVIEQAGGRLETGADVARIVIERGRASGVALADGRVVTARQAVVANVTPTQLYGRLLPDGSVPAETARRGRNFAYGRADMQIHVALSEPPDWHDPALAGVSLMHLTPGLEAVSASVRAAEHGALPAEATIVLGQPAAIDPQRCPPGASLLWIQLQELPRVIRSDAAGEIAVPADGAWTVDVARTYARRILARVGRHIRNLDRAMVGLAVLSPADLARENINLVGGDPYSGACSIDQFHLWRPFPSSRNHRTPIARLWHIGASTHPGPGLGGMSGYFVAQSLAKGRG